MKPDEGNISFTTKKEILAVIKGLGGTPELARQLGQLFAEYTDKLIETQGAIDTLCATIEENGIRIPAGCKLELIEWMTKTVGFYAAADVFLKALQRWE